MHPTEFQNVKLLKEIAEFINEETEIEAMLLGALRKFLKGTKFVAGWIFFIDENGKHQLMVSENLPEGLKQNGCSHLKNGSCWCVSRYRDRELEKASNIIECKRIENILAARSGDNGGITHHATVPLQSGQERFGVVNVASPNTVTYSEGELALLESLAFQLGSAIKRIFLTKQEQEIALLQERNRLAKDLHDSVNQLLFSVALTARGGAEMVAQAEIKETFKEIQNLSQEALNEMRALIWQLRPVGLENGLLEAIKGYGEMLGLCVQSHISGVLNVPSHVEEALFRISQEALNNVRKHSGVHMAELFMNVSQTDVLLVIKDEGQGFIIDHSIQIPSMGLQSMIDRAKKAGGSIEWDSEIGRGTEILIRIPY